MKYEEAIKKAYESFRPLQGLPIINYKGQFVIIRVGYGQFPSPTGVTYYKWLEKGSIDWKTGECFRPLQGLPIINPYLQNPDKHY